MFNFVFFFWFQIDEVRINQLYEQAKIQIITEEIDCTEEETITFAALQFQVKVASQNPQGNNSTDEVDDIDSALSELQVNKNFIDFPFIICEVTYYYLPIISKIIFVNKENTFNILCLDPLIYIRLMNHYVWSFFGPGFLIKRLTKIMSSL